MRVIIMRHGEAMFEGPERVLTSRGREEIKMTTLKLLSSSNITRIFCSPKKRAVQTAQVVSSLLRGKVPEIEILPELAPMGNASYVYDYVNAVAHDSDTILLISHIPQVLSLADVFTAVDCDVPRFVTGGALILQQLDSSASYPRFVAESFFTPSSELILPQTKRSAVATAPVATPAPAPVPTPATNWSHGLPSSLIGTASSFIGADHSTFAGANA